MNLLLFPKVSIFFPEMEEQAEIITNMTGTIKSYCIYSKPLFIIHKLGGLLL